MIPGHSLKTNVKYESFKIYANIFTIYAYIYMPIYTLYTDHQNRNRQIHKTDSSLWDVLVRDKVMVFPNYSCIIKWSIVSLTVYQPWPHDSEEFFPNPPPFKIYIKKEEPFVF